MKKKIKNYFNKNFYNIFKQIIYKYIISCSIFYCNNTYTKIIKLIIKVLLILLLISINPMELWTVLAEEVDKEKDLNNDNEVIAKQEKNIIEKGIIFLIYAIMIYYICKNDPSNIDTVYQDLYFNMNEDSSFDKLDKLEEKEEQKS